jgi:transposase-like protein
MPILTLTPDEQDELKHLAPQERLRWMIKVERRLSMQQVARQMGVTHVALLNWLKHTEGRPLRPGARSRRIIEKWSSTSVLGPISPDEWATEAEKQAVEHVFAPPAWAPASHR